jgi:hypothetical protein
VRVPIGPDMYQAKARVEKLDEFGVASPEDNMTKSWTRSVRPSAFSLSAIALLREGFPPPRLRR